MFRLTGDPSASSTPAKPVRPPTPPRSTSPRQSIAKTDRGEVGSSSELFKEYQKQRVKIQEEFEKQEQRRMQYQKQLMDLDTRGHCINEEDNRLSDVSYNGKNYDNVINDSSKSYCCYGYWLMSTRAYM